MNGENQLPETSGHELLTPETAENGILTPVTAEAAGSGLPTPEAVETTPQTPVPLETAEPAVGISNADQPGDGFDWDQFLETNQDKVKQALSAIMSGSSEADERDAELERKTCELEEKEKLVSFRQLQLDTVGMLEKKGLPASVMRLVVGGDLEATKQNIEVFETEFRRAVEAGVNDRLRGTPPGASASPRSQNTQGQALDSKYVRGIMTGGK